MPAAAPAIVEKKSSLILAESRTYRRDILSKKLFKCASACIYALSVLTRMWAPLFFCGTDCLSYIFSRLNMVNNCQVISVQHSRSKS